jgi:hypothetical protein
MMMKASIQKGAVRSADATVSPDRHGVLRLMMSYPRTITPTVCVDHSIFELQIVTESLHRGRSAVLNTLGQSANWPNIVPILPNVAFQQGVI